MSGGTPDGTGAQHPRQGPAPLAKRRRYRPDHPGEAPQTDRAHGLRPIRVRGMAQGPLVRH